uniref:Uncharacterized protein n=1 Tax=Setaria italica TaxID=4555 RepID=K3XTM5_SETIT
MGGGGRRAMGTCLVGWWPRGGGRQRRHHFRHRFPSLSPRPPSECPLLRAKLDGN